MEKEVKVLPLTQLPLIYLSGIILPIAFVIIGLLLNP